MNIQSLKKSIVSLFRFFISLIPERKHELRYLHFEALSENPEYLLFTVDRYVASYIRSTISTECSIGWVSHDTFMECGIDRDLLSQYHEGLIATTCCLAS